LQAPPLHVDYLNIVTKLEFKNLHPGLKCRPVIIHVSHLTVRSHSTLTGCCFPPPLAVLSRARLISYNCCFLQPYPVTDVNK